MKLLGPNEQLEELERSAPRLGQALRKYKEAEEARNRRIEKWRKKK